jgi:hypothetical protein
MSKAIQVHIRSEGPFQNTFRNVYKYYVNVIRVYIYYRYNALHVHQSVSVYVMLNLHASWKIRHKFYTRKVYRLYVCSCMKNLCEAPHSKSVGNVCKPYKCSLCGKGFTHMSARHVHEQTHVSRKPFTCSICNKRFSDHRNVLRHMNIHKDDKLFWCKIWWLSNSSLRLNVLLQVSHSKTFLFVCEVKCSSSR